MKEFTAVSWELRAAMGIAPALRKELAAARDHVSWFDDPYARSRGGSELVER
jgi:hypothetical protein